MQAVKRLVLIALSVMVITLLIACGSTPAVQSDKPNMIKMDGHAFKVTTITIQKGSTLTFVNSPDAGGLHILVVGKDGQNDSENGAPDFGGISGHRSGAGDAWATPPWNVAGTYHVTCTVHPMMNLTVIVTN
jgi:plastocyanin